MKRMQQPLSMDCAKLMINPLDDCKITLVADGTTYEVAVTYFPKISIAGLNQR